MASQKIMVEFSDGQEMAQSASYAEYADETWWHYNEQEGVVIMTVTEFFEGYERGSALITIGGYCEEKRYDYLSLSDWVEDDYDMKEFEKEALSGNNPNHYIATCLFREPWWDKIKDCEIKKWGIIGGGMDPVELYIDLDM